MNKVLVTVSVPLIEQEYNVWIPINKTIGMVKLLMEKVIIELSDNNFKSIGNNRLYNSITHTLYEDNLFVKDSDIRNGTKLVLL